MKPINRQEAEALWERWEALEEKMISTIERICRNGRSVIQNPDFGITPEQLERWDETLDNDIIEFNSACRKEFEGLARDTRLVVVASHQEAKR